MGAGFYMASKDMTAWRDNELGSRSAKDACWMQARVQNAIRDARQLHDDFAEVVLRLRLQRIASQSAYVELRASNAPSFRLQTERRVLLTKIVALAMRFTGADMGNIQVVEPTLGALEIKAQCGFSSPFLEYFNQVHQGESACGTAMKRARRVMVEDVTQSRLFQGSPALEVILDAGARSVQSTPLVDVSGRVLGVLSTHWRRPRRLSPSESWLLDVLAEKTTNLLRQLQTGLEQQPRKSDWDGSSE
jgi:hypothetical protein